MGPTTSLAERFHEATKYTAAGLGRQPGPDPRRQPPTFKPWHQGSPLALPRPGPALSAACPGPLDAARLGRLLLHTYGVTAVGQLPGATHFFRASPSAGALYPTELYVALQGVDGLPDGLHAYRAREHALACCWEGDFRRDLVRFGFDHPALLGARAVLIATCVFERSAWRYGDRAYRRVLLDTGHVLGNAVLAAPADGLCVMPVADFNDAAVDSLLLLDPAQEATVLLAAVLEGQAAPWREPGRSPTHADLASPPPGAWIPALHEACAMTERQDPLPAASAPPRPTFGTARLEAERPLEHGLALPRERVHAAIRRRRSTRAFRPAPLPAGDLGRILEYAHPAASSGEPRAAIAPALLETWIVVAGVEGLPQGVHLYSPARHTLAPVRGGDPRRALQAACLGQELGRDCAFAVLHVAHLPSAVARYGERAYRYLHLDAGLLGERLDLAALALGHGASGIGGFFDDELTALLGLTPEHAVAYVTVVGVPA